MFRSAQAALVVILVCFGIMQIPGQPQYAPLPSSVATQPEAILPVPDSDEIWSAIAELEASQKKLTGRVAQLEAAKKVAAVVPAVNYPAVSSPAAKSGGSTGGYTQSYSPRWQSNDGRTLRQHAIEIHGFDPSLSDAQLAQMHDAYHDEHGGMPPRIAPRYVPQYQPATISRSRSVQYSAGTSSCPGGVCPTSRSVQVHSSGGVFGFGIVGRRR